MFNKTLKKYQTAMNSDLISVVIPAHNAERFLGAAIESLLCQTWRDFELIIVDDGSTDSSPQIVERYARQDPRIVSVRLPENRGAATARNSGIERARGSLIAIHDADDASFPRRLETQRAFMQARPEIALAGTRAYIIDAAGRPVAPDPPFFEPAAIAAEMTRKRNRVRHGATIFRAKLNLHYRAKFRIADDLDLYLRLLSAGLQIANLPEILYQYRVSHGMLTVTGKMKQALEAEAALRFYQQRLNSGMDQYDAWQPEAELPGFAAQQGRDLRMTDPEFNYRINLVYLYFASGIYGEALREARELAGRYSPLQLGPRWSAILAWVRLRGSIGIALGRDKAPGADWPDP